MLKTKEVKTKRRPERLFKFLSNVEDEEEARNFSKSLKFGYKTPKISIKLRLRRRGGARNCSKSMKSGYKTPKIPRC
jgi:hypothetical protein